MVPNVEIIYLALDKLEKNNNNPAEFRIDHEISNEAFTRIVFESEYSAKIVIDASLEGIDIGIDECSEVISWGNDYLRTKKEIAVNKISEVLSSKIKIVSYGGGLKIIYIIRDGKKSASEKLIAVDGFIFNPFKRKVKCYEAVVREIKFAGTA